MIYKIIRKILLYASSSELKRYKNTFNSFGDKSQLNNYLGAFPWIYKPEYINIGKDTHIGGGFYFDGSGGLNIGNHVHISVNCTIYTSNHNYLSKKKMPYDNTYIYI